MALVLAVVFTLALAVAWALVDTDSRIYTGGTGMGTGSGIDTGSGIARLGL